MGSIISMMLFLHLHVLLVSFDSKHTSSKEELQCTPTQFFKYFCSNESNFEKEYHTKREDTDVKFFFFLRLLFFFFLSSSSEKLLFFFLCLLFFFCLVSTSSFSST